MDYKEHLKTAIIECNRIIHDWVSSGKPKNIIIFDLNGMIKTTIVRNLKSIDYKFNSQIINSIDIEGILNNNSDSLSGIIVKFTHKLRSSENIFNIIRDNIQKINFEELYLTQKLKSINNLDEIDFNTIKQIKF